MTKVLKFKKPVEDELKFAAQRGKFRLVLFHEPQDRYGYIGKIVYQLSVNRRVLIAELSIQRNDENKFDLVGTLNKDTIREHKNRKTFRQEYINELLQIAKQQIEDRGLM